MSTTTMTRAHIRERIEAAGLTLPSERADAILDAAPLVLAMTRRVHRAFAYADEPAAVVSPEGGRR